MKRDLKIIFLTVLNFLTLILLLGFNIAVSVLPLNSISTKEVSDKYPALIVPYSVTFSIWFIIYILLVLFVLNQLNFIFKRDKKRGVLIEKVGILFFLSSLFNVLWLFCWHYEKLFLSVLVIILLLITLIILYIRLGIGKKDFSESLVFVKTPISVYLAWISVATIANISSYLGSLNLYIFDNYEILWTILMIIISLFLAIFMVLKNNDIIFALVFIWAYIGIIMKQIMFNDKKSIQIILIILSSIIILTFFATFDEIKKYKNKKN
ncbi:MAG: tryptophan-rich sensory protein [candidate division WOR-3 bacterium]